SWIYKSSLLVVISIIFDAYVIEETDIWLPFVPTSNWKRPSDRVDVPILVPIRCTVAPAIGFPTLSVTSPVTTVPFFFSFSLSFAGTSVVSLFNTCVSTPTLTLPCAAAFAVTRNAGIATWKKYLNHGMRFLGISILLSS